MEDFEKLGVFYLGKTYDLKNKVLGENLVLYSSKDLVTHAVCVGMTGSGKTGLCLALIEEAALDGIPSILIDPKGDLADLLLTFPQLRPEDFQPWVNPDDATNKGMSIPDYAKQQSQFWQKGLNDWGESRERIQKLRDAVDFRIYTPGSNAGFPVSILHSFAAPQQNVIDDTEMMRDRVNTTVASLLGLVGIDADPNQSREAILLANIMDFNWRQGRDLTIESLILQVQNPPIQKIGIMDLDMYYPAKERFALVMALNNLLASPGFNVWLQGEALDIDNILRTPRGKPRVAIFSIAHLNDNERMFFVSLLLNQVLGWVRSQSGTNSLRAILYMDEIFGFLPPVSNPASKLPMLTLLKQSRAFGLGLVLATQNPVDLDYKALSNTGTWFIGRLQTDRDKQRLLDGLEGVAAAQTQNFNRPQMEQILAGLGSRVFLLNNVHEDQPEIFESRWLMSYLRGPLTRDQIKILMDPIKQLQPVEVQPQKPVATASSKGPIAASGGQEPTIPPEIQRFYIPPSQVTTGGVLFQPGILGIARIRFAEPKYRIDITQIGTFISPVTDAAIPVDWQQARTVNLDPNKLSKTPTDSGDFTDLPDAAMQKNNYALWARDFTSWVSANQSLKLFRSPDTGMISNQGESEKDFRVRLSQSAREGRDGNLEKLRQKYAPKLAALQDRLERAQQAVEREKSQARSAGLATAVSIGATLLGAFTGRKLISTSTIGRASTAIKGASRAAGQQGDVNRAKDTVEGIQQQINDLNAQFEAEKTQLGMTGNPLTDVFEIIEIKPKKTDVAVQLVTLVWEPFQKDSGQPAW
jgi:hypothetical protein